MFLHSFLEAQVCLQHSFPLVQENRQTQRISSLVHTVSRTLRFQLVAIRKLSHNCFNSTGIHILFPFSFLILFVLSFCLNQAGKGISFSFLYFKSIFKNTAFKIYFLFSNFSLCLFQLITVEFWEENIRNTCVFALELKQGDRKDNFYILINMTKAVGRQRVLRNMGRQEREKKLQPTPNASLVLDHFVCILKWFPCV